MSSFAQTLKVVLSEDKPVTANLAVAAKTIVSALEAARQKVKDLEHQLNTVHSRLSAELALSIRRTDPALNVSVTRDGCKVGYKTKHLLLVPNLPRGVWDVKSSDPQFSRIFFRYNSSTTVIDNDTTKLAASVTDFFRNHYKSLGEDIVGTGIVLIDNLKGTLSGLVTWREQFDVPLNSRSTVAKW